jgi:hypothetical protein
MPEGPRLSLWDLEAYTPSLWEAPWTAPGSTSLAIAYDAACRARATRALARAQHQDMLTQRRDLEQQRIRSREHAERIRAWWSRYRAMNREDKPSD